MIGVVQMPRGFRAAQRRAVPQPAKYIPIAVRTTDVRPSTMDDVGTALNIVTYTYSTYALHSLPFT